MRTDSLDVQPQDLDQLHEIDLTSELMIASSRCPHARLPQDVIDAVLHIADNPS
jgi:hypothetical protein